MTDTKGSAGRGGLAILSAKVFFMLMGFLQTPLLSRVLGDAEFGLFALVLAPVNILNNTLIQSSTQGVSRRVAGAPAARRETLRVLRAHAPLAFLGGALAFLLSPFYARAILQPRVETPLFVLSSVTLLYGFYGALVGAINGRKAFVRQAALDMLFAVLRTCGLVACGYFFQKAWASGALGAGLGWMLAIVLVLPLATRWGLARGPREEAPLESPKESYQRSFLSIAFAQLPTNLLLQIDIPMLGRALSRAALEQGLPAETATVWTAVYKQCQTFALLPYQLLFSVTLVLFPMLAEARGANEKQRITALVSRGMRLALLFSGLIVSVIATLPGPLLALAYGTKASAHGASVLQAMMVGQFAFAMLGICTTVLTSLGHEKKAAKVTLLSLVIVCAAFLLLSSGGAVGQKALFQMTWATGLAFALALLVAARFVHREAGALAPARSVLRVVFVTLFLTGSGFFLPPLPRLATPLLALLVAGAYVLLLRVSGEIGAEDVAGLREVLKRKARR